MIHNKNINLGDVKFGVPKTFKVPLSNTSNKPVVIKRLLPSCSACTVMKTEKSVIMPGETLDIEFVFTPGSTGVLRKQGTVYYDIGDQSTSEVITFTAKCDG